MSERTVFKLFGYPIAHSASPAFHNKIFEELGLANRYTLHDTVHPENINTDIKSDMLDIIHSDTFGGASVTMPIKVIATKYVDRLEQAAKEIGSINTIIVEKDSEGKTVLVGENYDWAGVHNALVQSLPEQEQSKPNPFGEGKNGFIIGGGGTTRAAVYALSQLSISPIFLINRDPQETKDIIAAFPQYDLRPLEDVSLWTPELAANLGCGVGAIPSFEPVTDGEKMVYAVATKIFDSEGSKGKSFLEMCYKPRNTIMMKIAEARGWKPICGIEAMIEQGFAQNRAWVLRSAASPWNGERKEFGPEVEAAARAHVRNMADI